MTPDQIAPALEVIDLDVSYGQAKAVDGFSVAVASGSCVGLVGANGAGKTSILRCIAGLQRSSKGIISVNGHEVHAWKPWARANFGVRFVPETRELFWELSVAENLRLGVHGQPDKEEAIEVATTVFPVLKKLWKRRARLLSGGEQQMLAIGRALAGQPQLLILDEPSLGLAPTMVGQLMRSLRQIQENGLSMLIAEQNLGIPRAICDEIVLMRLGRTVASGPASRVLESEQLQRAFLGG